MSLPDIALPVLGAIVFIKPFFAKRTLKWHDYAQIFVGVIIMGLSIYSSITTSQSSETLQSSVNELLNNRNVDSTDNANF